MSTHAAPYEPGLPREEDPFDANGLILAPGWAQLMDPPQNEHPPAGGHADRVPDRQSQP